MYGRPYMPTLRGQKNIYLIIHYLITVELGYDVTKGTEYFVSL